MAQKQCEVLHLPIDWKKSFVWSTCRKLRRFWDNEAKALLPAGAEVRRVSDAKDLGVWFQFQARRRQVGHDKRVEEGKQRLDRLRKQPRDVQSKFRLLVNGIWPQMLYGMEGRVLPKATVDMVRSRAARAITSSGPSQSPTLILSAVVPAIADPEVYMMVQSATALRRAFEVMPGVAQRVLTAASSLEFCTTALGPATALFMLFHRNDWVISSDGWCYGPGMYCFSLKVSSRRQITKAVQQAWTDSLHAKLAHRNGLHALGAISGVDTTMVIRSLPHTLQKTAANCVAGGHMSAAARSQWDPLQEPVCPFCGAVDTKVHRVYHCPVFDNIRIAFRPMLDWVSQHAGHWVHAACIEEHPDLHVLQLMFRARPCVRPPKLCTVPYEGARVLFTDGTCTVPQAVQSRHAAWAVVEDAAQHVPTSALVSYFQQTRKLIPGFHVVAQGLVPREQTIGRAEVVAALQACMLAQDEPETIFHVHIDSTYALSFLDKPGHNAPRRPSTDLDLCEWTGVWVRPPNVVLHKVKSHSDVDTLPEPQARYAIGNSIADQAAKAARQADAPFVYPLLEAVEARSAVHRDMLRAYILYQRECAKRVALLAKSPCADPPDEGDDRLDSGPQLLKWQALSPVHVLPRQFPELSDRCLEAAPWPPWYVSQVWAWAVQLRWPDRWQPAHPLDSVSHFELLCDFILASGVCPPLPAPDGRGTVVPVSSTEGALIPLSVKDMVLTLAATLKFLSKVTQLELIPAVAHKKVPSLQTLGCHAARRGFVPRPQLVTQSRAGYLVWRLLQAQHPGEVVRPLERIPENQYAEGSAVHDQWRSLTVHQRETRRRALGR